ncbi:MAG: ADP-ribosylglycohydrolase [Firmicutes bacterium]|nr:ADP-ribosylglycohydrolase [Bacillota bacterium]
MMTNSSVMDSVLGFTVADALGVPIEFKSRSELRVNPLKEMIGYGSHNVPEGTWSDDTSMMLATMDSIIETNDIDYDDMMKKYCEWYAKSKYTATGVTFDIGISTRKALLNFYNGKAALDCGGKGEFDNGNGSLMRILPIALYSFYNNLNEKEEIELLNNCSSMTHGHEISKLGCKIYTDFIKKLLNGENKEKAFEQISNKDYSNYYSKESIEKYKRLFNKNFKDLNISQIKSSGYIVDTLEACIWCILNTHGYEDAVVKAINLGEDTDTIGAITGSIAGIIYGNKEIPERWKSKLRNKEDLLGIIDKYNDYLLNDVKKLEDNNVKK